MSTKITPEAGLNSELLVALMLVKAFVPASTQELFVDLLQQEPQPEGDPLAHKYLAKLYAHPGYREATLSLASELLDESGRGQQQVILHELVHLHHQGLDTLFRALLETIKDKRVKRAFVVLYEAARESVADDISAGIMDLLEAERERQKMACLFKMADDMVERLNAEKAKEQAIW